VGVAVVADYIFSFLVFCFFFIIFFCVFFFFFFFFCVRLFLFYGFILFFICFVFFFVLVCLFGPCPFVGLLATSFLLACVGKFAFSCSRISCQYQRGFDG